MDWIREGGAVEDEFLGIELLGALVRSRHHFHNPLLAWEQAGLNALTPCPPFVLSGQASVRWAQNPDQGISGKAAWKDARDAFYDALTRRSKNGEQNGEAGRDQRWANTFRILGQQMHLVADLAVPAHTRNDQHCPGADGFEGWAKGNRSAVESRISGSPIEPPKTIFKVGIPSDDPIARVPIARLWDGDQYTRELGNPGVTAESRTIGLAEYSNANFFSDDTVFSSDFPFPATTSADLGTPEPEPKRGEPRRYFKKTRDGEKIDHLAVPSALYSFLPDALKDRRKGLDAKVFDDYAAKLLPRAVGYSAALLDYFFRGSLTVEQVSWDEDGVFIVVENNTDEEMEGRFELWGIHGRDTDVEERVRLVDLNGGQVTRLSRFGGRQFQLSVPADARPTADYMLVFRGRLGDEQDAVVGRVFTVPHALVIQQDYRADLTGVCGRTGTAFLPSPPDYVQEFSRQSCDWRATSHTLSGQIVTNSPRPILQRIEARWFGRFPGPAPVTLDGKTYPAGVWQRDGMEPDPTAFSIADPTWRDGAILIFMIDLIGGGSLETSLPTFGRNSSSHNKEIVVHDPGADADRSFLVTSGRAVGLSATYNWAIEDDARRPLFRASSISGRTNPTDTFTFREFHSFEFGEGVRVTPTSFSESVIDDFILLPPGTTEQGTREPFLAIEPLLDPQTSQGPFITWQADIERVYQPRELEFLRAFMTASPPQYSVPLRGTQR